MATLTPHLPHLPRRRRRAGHVTRGRAGRLMRRLAPLRLAIAILGGAATLATGFLLAVMVVIPLTMHWVPLTILSGSMTPTIPVDSQVVVKRVETEADVDRLRVGDIITFLPNPNDPTLVTHRITSISVNSNGVHSVRTKGDHNRSEDPTAKTVDQVRGVVVYHIPWVGHIAQALDPHQKTRGIYLAAATLFTYAAYEISRALTQARAPRTRGQKSA